MKLLLSQLNPIIPPLIEKGILGIVIIALGVFIWYLMKMAERRQERFDKFVDQVQGEMITTIKENTNVLSGLKSLIESIDRRT